MDTMLFLLLVFLLFIGIGLYAGIRNHLEERRALERKRLDDPAPTSPTYPEANTMSRTLPMALVALLCFALACVVTHAQEVVHARAGQVVAVNTTNRTLTLMIADGSTLVFHDVTTPAPNLSFDKALRDKTVPVADFSKLGSRVVVFYYGYGVPTAVAIKDLGPDAVTKTDGSVASFDRHQHVLTLKTSTTGPQKLVLNDNTVVDTADGVVKLSDYHPSKGQQLHCLTKAASQDALLVIPD